MRHVAPALVCTALLACALPAVAQEKFPQRPIRIVVPFPPGGTSDIVTRILGEKLSAAFGQTIVVDNRPGAAGMLGTDIVAKAAPDGHTLFMAFVSHSINPFVYAKLPYDTEKDFAPVALVAVQVHIPSLPVTMPFIKSGRLRAIAVTSAKRSPVLPDVATVAETLPGYESLAWYGLLAPVKTSPALVERLSAEVKRAVSLPDVNDALAKQGADPTYRDPKGFAAYLAEERKRWSEAVKAAGIKPGAL